MKRCVLAALLVFGFVAPVKAANQFVKCVQEQLLAMEYDPGPIDGALGKRTRAALAKAIKDKSELASLPRISNRYAVTWCRTLGQHDAALRRFYPSHEKPIVVADEGKDSSFSNYNYQKTTLRVALFWVTKWLAEEHNVELASRSFVVGSTDPKNVESRIRKLQRQFKFHLTPKGRIRKSCTTKSRFKGVAYAHAVAICFETGVEYNSEWASKEKLNVHYLVAHEYFHMVQREYSANKVPTYYKKSKGPPPPIMQPSWLVEGSADYFAAKYIESRFNRTLGGGVRAMTRRTQKLKRSLSAIAKKRALTDSDDYQVAILAVRLLGDRYGTEALLGYWADIGLGKSHAAAFKDAFEMTLLEFQKKFEALRKSPDEAVQFARATG